MSIDNTCAVFKKFNKLFCCPICSHEMLLTNKSFICRNNHCFDLSAKGYVNFILNQKPTKYDKELFAARQQVFEAGYYVQVADEIKRIISEITNNKHCINVLDVGCGEGYYASGLSVGGFGRILGMDISKDAIAMAQRAKTDVGWMVADLAKIPISSRSVDVLLNILTPANYSEFLRVLSDDGFIIKIIPGDGYLQEIRNMVYNKLKNKEYSNRAVAKHLEENMNVVSRKRLCYTRPVSKDDAMCFLRMTPMTFGIDLEKADMTAIDNITIDMEVIVAKKL